MKKLFVNRERFFTFEYDDVLGDYYIGFPSSNGAATYTEYYLISEKMFDNYPNNSDEVEVFLKECRSGNMSHLRKLRSL